MAELDVGFGVRLREAPAAHLANEVHVEDPAATPAAVVAACEAHHGDLAHRRATVPDGALGARLAPALAAQGWSAHELLRMAWRRPADRPASPAAAGVALVVEEERFARAERAGDAELLPDADALDDLALARARARAAFGPTCGLVAVDGGVDAAHATLYDDGRVAQLEDLVTLRAHRGRGLARALVGLAQERAADHELLFLVAEADDWPRALYERLGFDVVGTSWVLTRVGVGR